MIKLIIAGLCLLCLLNISAYAEPVKKPRRRRSRATATNINYEGPCVDPRQTHGLEFIPLKYKQ